LAQGSGFAELNQRSTMKALLARLDKWFAKHRKHFHKNLQASVPATELDALGKVLGKPVPTSLAALLKWHNGQGDDYVGYFENHWLLMSAGAIVAAKQELDAGVVDGWLTDWIPFCDDDGGDFLVLDTRQSEPAVLAFYLGQSEALTVAPSLEAWLEDFARSIEAGDYVEDRERGTFTRSQKGK
jgi:cell wall assembly regulator SMI1